MIQLPRTALTSLHCWTWNGDTLDKRSRVDVEREHNNPASGINLGLTFVFDTEVNALSYVLKHVEGTAKTAWARKRLKDIAAGNLPGNAAACVALAQF